MLYSDGQKQTMILFIYLFIYLIVVNIVQSTHTKRTGKNKIK